MGETPFDWLYFSPLGHTDCHTQIDIIMLRATAPGLIYMTIGNARLGGGYVPKNATLDRIIINVKEKTKRTSYYGAYITRNPDRELMYAHSGGPKQGRFWIKRQTYKNQYAHWNASWDKYFVQPMNNNPWQGLGGIHRNIWDHTASSSNSLWDTGFKYTMKNTDKNAACRVMDMWGMKYTLFDERTQPKMIDFSYVRHKLYAHNFPWKKDPVLGAGIGDADYDWRGTEKLDYSSYGSTTKTARNSFTSMWDELKKQAAIVPVSAKAKKGTA